MKLRTSLLPAIFSGLVFAGSCMSLLSGQAPRWSCGLEYFAFVVTLPAALLSRLIRLLDEDSFVLWSAAIFVWIVATAVLFWTLAVLAQFVAKDRLRLWCFLGVALTALAVSILWLVSAWPAAPQEDPPLYFIRVPLWCVTAIVFLVLIVVVSHYFAKEARRL